MKYPSPILKPYALKRFFKATFIAGILPVFLLLLSIRSTQAGSALWNLNPTSGDWNTVANWTPSTVPNGPRDTVTSATPTNRKETFGQSRLAVHSQEAVATPTLGNYPNTSLLLSTDTTVTPDAAPTNTDEHQCFHLDQLQRHARRRSDDGRGAGNGRASGGDIHGDGQSFRQRWCDRDQDVHPDGNDAGDLQPG